MSVELLGSMKPSITAEVQPDGSIDVEGRSITSDKDVFKMCVFILNNCAARMGSENSEEFIDTVARMAKKRLKGFTLEATKNAAGLEGPV